MKDSYRKLISIGPGRTETLTATGSKILVETANTPFILALGDANENVVKGGCEIILDDTFNSIRVTNPSLVTLKAAIWIGSARVNFHYPTLPATALVTHWGSLTGTAVTAPTSFVEGGLLTSLGALFPGTATGAVRYSSKGVPEGARRKQFVVSNPSNTEDLYISTGDLYVFAFVTTNGHYTLETDADIRLHGKTSGNTYYVAEIFYL